MKFLYVIPFIFLFGCGTTSTNVVTAQIPVAVTTKPADVVRPTLTSGNLTTDDNDVFVKALEIDLTLMKKYATDLENVIEVYKKEIK